MRYGDKWPEYARQWDAMVINASREQQFRTLALKFIDLKPRYVPLADQTGIPWQIFAVMHMRESDNDFSKSLAQGDPWNRQSTNEPISGPFSSFEESAIWTMNHDGLIKVVDWRLEKQLWHLERLNGMGYANGPKDIRSGITYPPMPSPYIWGGTNQQRPGKYIRDHVFDPDTMDTQPGCAPILWMIAKLDPTVQFVRETPMGIEPPSEVPVAEIDELRQTVTALSRQVAEIASILGQLVPKPPIVPVPPVTPVTPPVSTVPVTPPGKSPFDPTAPVNLSAIILGVISAIIGPKTGAINPLETGGLSSFLPFILGGSAGIGLPQLLFDRFFGPRK